MTETDTEHADDLVTGDAAMSEGGEGVISEGGDAAMSEGGEGVIGEGGETELPGTCIFSKRYCTYMYIFVVCVHVNDTCTHHVTCLYMYMYFGIIIIVESTLGILHVSF